MLSTNSANFQNDILNFNGLVLVDFWAPWCGPCLALGPILEEISTQMKDNTKFKIVKVNSDENEDLSIKYNIRGIPNMKFIKNGKLVGELVGLYPKDIILQKINDHLSDSE